MGQGSGTRGRRVRLVAAVAALAGLVVLAGLGVVGPAPGEDAAGLVTRDAQLFLRIPSVSMALDLVGAARAHAPGHDQALRAAHHARGYHHHETDTRPGHPVDLDAPLAVALVPAPPLAGVLVIVLPIRSGTPALDGANLLFARLPMAARPRLDRDATLGAVPGTLRVGQQAVAALVELEDDVLVALPLGSGDVEAGFDGWMARTLDPDGRRLGAESGVRDALRTHRDAPLLILCRDDADGAPCVRTPDDPAAVLGQLIETIGY